MKSFGMKFYNTSVSVTYNTTIVRWGCAFKLLYAFLPTNHIPVETNSSKEIEKCRGLDCHFTGASQKVSVHKQIINQSSNCKQIRQSNENSIAI